MKKVVTINLGGNAYQLEGEGLDVLSAYLDVARSRLQGNPDLEEITADLELAVADKMNRFLSANKTVVSSGEVRQIVEEMGPIHSPLGAGDAAELESQADPQPVEARTKPSTARKLYKLTGDDEKMLAGVCAGLAAYSGLDVSIVRIVFVALVLATGGLALVGYLALALIIPAARTPQQEAAAYGVPFDARGVVDQAKAKLGATGTGKQWRAQQRYWNRHARNAGFDGIGSFVGLVVLLLGILIGLVVLSSLFQAFVPAARISQPFGPPYYPMIPAWMSLLVVAIGVSLLAWMVGRGSGERPSLLGSLLIKTVQVFLILFVFWIAYHTFPFFRELVHALLGMLNGRLW